MTGWVPSPQLPLKVRYELDGFGFNAGVDPVDGCEYVVNDDAGLRGRPGPRASRQQRFQAHGDYSGPQWSEGRDCTLSGWIFAPTVEARDTAEHRLAAICNSVTDEFPLTVTTETRQYVVHVRQAGAVVTAPNPGGLSAVFSVPVHADDPAKYLAAQQDSTGLPQAGIGLDWEENLATATRANLARNTTGAGLPAWTPYNANSTVAVRSLTASPAGVDVRPVALRSTCTVAGVHGGSLPIAELTAATWYTVSAYVRSSAARTATMYLTWANAGGVISTTTSATTALAANTWARMHLTAQAPAGADRVTASWTVAGAAVAETLDTTAALAETSASGAAPGVFFDGSSAGCSWRGGSYASVAYNVRHGLDWAAPGLDWGTPSSTGSLEIANGGNTDTWAVVYTVHGPTDPGDPALVRPIVTLSTGQQYAYNGTLQFGEYLVIDNRRRSVLLNGTTRRRGLMPRPQWTAIPANSTVTAAFTASTSPESARLVVDWAPALA